MYEASSLDQVRGFGKFELHPNDLPTMVITIRIFQFELGLLLEFGLTFYKVAHSCLSLFRLSSVTHPSISRFSWGAQIFLSLKDIIYVALVNLEFWEGKDVILGIICVKWIFLNLN